MKFKIGDIVAVITEDGHRGVRGRVVELAHLTNCVKVDLLHFAVKTFDEWAIPSYNVWFHEDNLTQLCMCGEKSFGDCTEDQQWEPGCDLGNNPLYAKVV